jgi:SAM-dependent methyltransferase
MNLEEARVLYEACPLCDSKEIREEQVSDCSRHPLYQREIPARMRWLRCAACDHVFTEGYFTPRALDLLFASVNPHQRPGWDWHGTRAISARMVEKVRAALGDAHGRWLDVGFGNGALLGTASEYGFEAIGLDLRPDSVERMRLYGIEAHAKELTDYRPALVHARELLGDDGVLFLSMPNADCFVWKRLDDAGENPYWGELEHYHNFGYRRLRALLEECGFRATSYGISERYYMCMEVIARKRG